MGTRCAPGGGTMLAVTSPASLPSSRLAEPAPSAPPPHPRSPRAAPPPPPPAPPDPPCHAHHAGGGPAFGAPADHLLGVFGGDGHGQRLHHLHLVLGGQLLAGGEVRLAEGAVLVDH